MVMPSGPGAPWFAFTFFQACSRLDGSTKASVRDIGNKLKAGFSSDAVAESSGRTGEPAVRSLVEPERYGPPGGRGFPRDKSLDGSSLFFLVRPFLPRLDFEDQYYGLC